jgi:hypothetical protein
MQVTKRQAKQLNAVLRRGGSFLKYRTAQVCTRAPPPAEMPYFEMLPEAHFQI